MNLVLFICILLNLTLVKTDESCPSPGKCAISSPKHDISCHTQFTNCSNVNNTMSPAKKAENLSIKQHIEEPTPGTEQYSKLWLSFSWEASLFAQEFEVEIYRRRKNENMLHMIRRKHYCFASGQNLDLIGPFTLSDCYGNGENEEVESGDHYEVVVIPHPMQKVHKDLKSKHASVVLDVPSCQRINQIYQPSKPTKDCSLSLDIVEYFCKNSTYHFSYHIPTYGNKTEEAELIIQKGLELVDAKWLSSDRTDYFYELPNSLMLKAELEHRDIRTKILKIQKTECVDPLGTASTLSESSLPAVTISLVICAFLLLLLAVVLLWKRKKLPRCCVSPSKTKKPDRDAVVYANPANIVIYIVCVHDNQEHTAVVLQFASFLQCNLGFQVVFELWEQEKIYKDSLLWMENALNKANKIIAVWSPAAKQCWKNRNMNVTTQTDLFCPVLKRIESDLLANKNVTKYSFVYFDYCSEFDIPEEFRKFSSCSFRLMDQIEKLYCRLHGSETIASEVKVSIESFANPMLNKHEASLQEPIKKVGNTADLHLDLVKANTVKAQEEDWGSDSGFENPFEISPSISLQTTFSGNQLTDEIDGDEVESKQVKPDVSLTLDGSVLEPIEISLSPDSGFRSPSPMFSNGVETGLTESQTKKDTKNDCEVSLNLDGSVVMPIEISLSSNDDLTTQGQIALQQTDKLDNKTEQSLPPVGKQDRFVDSLEYEQQLQCNVSTFSFSESDVVIHNAPNHPIKLEPMDMSGNPWASLAMINQS